MDEPYFYKNCFYNIKKVQNMQHRRKSRGELYKLAKFGTIFERMKGVQSI